MKIEQLTDPDSFIKSLTNQDSDNNLEFKLRRADSINSVNSYFFKQNPSHQTSTNNEQLNKKKINSDQIYLRLCMNCSGLLEKKFKSFKDRLIRPQFLNIYDVSSFYSFYKKNSF